MADLAKVDPHIKSLPQTTFNRETTEPRVSTDTPGAEVNATIRRPRTDNADELARILGVASDVAQKAFAQAQDAKDQQDAGAAVQDFLTGSQNAQKYAKSAAYYAAWQKEGAKKLAVDVSDEVTQKVQDRLNNSDNPATPEEIDAIIEQTFASHIRDKNGQLLNFGTPEATSIVANGFNEIRSNLIPQALAAIRKQTDAKYLTTKVYNAVHEFYRGAPIGTPRKVDPLAPLPDTVAPVDTSIGSTQRQPIEPFKGFTKMEPISGLGAPRQGGSRHNGEDYPIQSGTALVAPMQGTVISTPTNARGGIQVRVRMADGAILGLAHLSKLEVKTGDKVSGGQLLGLSGATGDATGPHVHMTVEVNGKKVSAKRYFASAKVPSGLPSGPADDGQGPALAANQQPAPVELKPFDVEGFMKTLPPSINKTDAKQFLLQSLFNEARDQGNPSLLAGLEDSKRPDGTPSFTPKEAEAIIANREQIADKADADQKKAQNDLWEKNADTILTAALGSNPPSEGFIRGAVAKGQLKPEFGYSLVHQMDSEARTQAAELRQEERQSQAEANAALDQETAGMIALRTTGALDGVSAESDLQLLNSGRLGTGKRALSRYSQLRAAARAGETENLRNPDVAKYAGLLQMQYRQKGSQSLLEKHINGAGQVNLYGMLAYYKRKVSEGENPEDAYLEAIKQFAPKQDAVRAREQAIAQMRARRLAAGR